MLNAMQRWRRGTLLIQFQCWASRTAVAIKAKQQLNVCVRRLQKRLATVAFQGWLARTIEIHRQRVILTRAVVSNARLRLLVADRCASDSHRALLCRSFVFRTASKLQQSESGKATSECNILADELLVSFVIVVFAKPGSAGCIRRSG